MIAGNVLYTISEKIMNADPTNRRGMLSEIAMEKMSKQLDNLYLVGARNFVVVDVPPVQRTPAGMGYLTFTSEIWAHQHLNQSPPKPSRQN